MDWSSQVYLDGTLSFAGFLEQICPFQLTWVIGLPVHGNTVESILERFARAGVHHAGLRAVSQMPFVVIASDIP
jgi:hypothetical protein